MMSSALRACGCIVGLLLLSACGGTPIDAPLPFIAEPDHGQDSVQALPPSFVTAPITFDLRPVLRELERTLPRTIGSVEDDDRIQVGSSPTVWLAAELERGPLRFRFDQQTLTIATTFQYRGRAWVRALVASPSFSCGLEGDRPRMRVAIRTTWDVTDDWRLRTRSSVTRVEPLSSADRDRCEVSFLDIDVTGKVAEAARKGLDAALRDADLAIARLDLRDPVGHLWAVLQRPISIDDGRFWLAIGPESISLGRVEARDSMLTATLSLKASPRIVSAPRPPAGQRPLPDLSRVPHVDSAVVFMEGLLRYEEANRILDEELAGRSVRMGIGRVRIERVEAMHGGAGRLILAIDLRGRARGRIYLAGTPTYDAETDLITVPDLALDVNTESYIDRTLGWFATRPFIGLLRERARLPASSLLDRAVALANQEVDRELEEGVFLRGSIGDARTVEVRASAAGLRASAFALGSLRLDLRMQDLVPDSIPDPLLGR